MRLLKCGYTAGVGAGTFFDIDARLADAIDSGIVAVLKGGALASGELPAEQLALAS